MCESLLIMHDTYKPAYSLLKNMVAYNTCKSVFAWRHYKCNLSMYRPYSHMTLRKNIKEIQIITAFDIVLSCDDELIIEEKERNQNGRRRETLD